MFIERDGMLECPNCGRLVKPLGGEGNYLINPHYCPHCNFDMDEYERQCEEETLRAAEESPLNQLRYDITVAAKCGVTEEPTVQMVRLGYGILETIKKTDTCWWFTVDQYRDPIPPYLMKICYTHEPQKWMLKHTIGQILRDYRVKEEYCDYLLDDIMEAIEDRLPLLVNE